MVVALFLLMAGFSVLANAHPLLLVALSIGWGAFVAATNGDGLFGTFFEHSHAGTGRLATLGLDGLGLVAGLGAVVGVAIMGARILGARSGAAEARRINALRIRTEEQAGGASALEAAEHAARTAPPATGPLNLVTGLGGIAAAVIALIAIGQQILRTGSVNQTLVSDDAPGGIAMAFAVLALALALGVVSNSAGVWAGITLFCLAVLAMQDPSVLREFEQLPFGTTEEWAAFTTVLPLRFPEVLAAVVLAGTGAIDGQRKMEYRRIVDYAKGG